MKDAEFEGLLRSGLKQAELSGEFAGAVGVRAVAITSRRKRVRRAGIGIGATAAATLAVLFVPTLSTYAGMSRIYAALDGVERVRVTMTSFDSKGFATTHEYLSRDHDAWFLGMYGHPEIMRNGVLYSFDGFAKCYVRQEKPRGPFWHGNGSLRLSELVRSAGSGGLPSIAHSMVNGKPMLCATLDNDLFHERYVIWADPQTELPQQAWLEKVEGKTVLSKKILNFDYHPRFAPGTFELDTRKYPVVTEAELQDRTARDLSASVVDSAEHGNRRVTLNRVDVAQDGTVYVVFDPGNHVASSFSGYAFVLKDSLGTRYVRQEMITGISDDGSSSPLDRFEVEEFVPYSSSEVWRPRTLTLSCAFKDVGTIDRGVSWMTVKPGGTEVLHDPWEGKSLKVFASVEVGVPTCAVIPSYLTEMGAPNLWDETSALIRRDSIRARAALEGRDWATAARSLEDELIQMDRSSGSGMQWDESQVSRDLEKARNGLVRP